MDTIAIRNSLKTPDTWNLLAKKRNPFMFSNKILYFPDFLISLMEKWARPAVRLINARSWFTSLSVPRINSNFVPLYGREMTLASPALFVASSSSFKLKAINCPPKRFHFSLKRYFQLTKNSNCHKFEFHHLKSFEMTLEFSIRIFASMQLI